MDDWLVIILLSLAMLVGCYVAGCIPLMFSLSEDKLKIVTIFGAGLLVGTALCIIIPEGIDSMYHTHKHITHSHEPKISQLPQDVKPLESESIIRRKIQEVAEEKKSEVEVTNLEDEKHDHSDKHNHSDNHKLIGITLVFGFVFMLLVDQIGGGSHSHGAPSHDATNSAGETINMGSHSRHRITATIGLCVHAAADGVALGAATSVKQAGLTLIVFIAIMLHKAPAAFGLVSFLLHDNMDRARIRKHLLAFSLAAPIGSLLTYFILNHQNKEWLAEWNATGLAMLFSAGTFLYVATVHILPEVSSKSSRTVALDGTVIIREHKGFNKSELFAIVLGSVLPVGISLGHSHAH